MSRAHINVVFCVSVFCFLVYFSFRSAPFALPELLCDLLNSSRHRQHTALRCTKSTYPYPFMLTEFSCIWAHAARE